jgi:rhodanese-related sulfurtransferase
LSTLISIPIAIAFLFSAAVGVFFGFYLAQSLRPRSNRKRCAATNENFLTTNCAIHLSRGTIELDIEEKFPDENAMIICHCGGGGRSALAAESLQKMGYKNVRSMAGGFKAWKAAGLPTMK